MVPPRGTVNAKLTFLGRLGESRLAKPDQSQQSRFLGHLNVDQFGIASARGGWCEESFDIFGNERALKHQGQVKESFCTFDPGNQLSFGNCIHLLQRCIKVKDISEGKLVHAHIVSRGLKPTIFLVNTLMNMYINCGLMIDARQLFDKMTEKNVFTWTLIIAGYAKHGQDQEAFSLFLDMKRQGVKPDIVAYVSILRVCSSLANLEEGKYVHAEILKNGSQSDIIIGTTLIDMYTKCQSLDDARRVFDKLPKRDVVAWDVMIAAYALHGYSNTPFELFLQMQMEGVMPDELVFVNILKVCGNVCALEDGKRIHVIIPNEKKSDLIVETALVDLYVKCGIIEEAQKVFGKMRKQDVVSCGVMIAGYADRANTEEAFSIFSRMQHDGISPDNVTFVGMLKACANAASLEQGKHIHACIIRIGFELDAFVCSTLIDMYAKCRSIGDACVVFNGMTKHDMVSWNAIISGYANHGNAEGALQFFCQMQGRGMKPDEVSFLSVLKACATLRSLNHAKRIHVNILGTNVLSQVGVGSALIDMYAKCGSLQEARKVFDSLSHQDVVSWNTIISSYIQDGHSEVGFELFLQMGQAGLQPDEVTGLIILKASADLGAMDKGRKTHYKIVESGLDSYVCVKNVLVDMYAKCGSMADAHQVFDSVAKPNLVSWNSLISGYVQRGYREQAFKLFEMMRQEDAKPDEVTFICMLKACADIADVEQGELIHAHISNSGYESSIFVSSTLVDMYSKCGNIKKARQVFSQMPERNVVSWTTMIAGYSQHGHYEEALELFLEMQDACVKADKVAFITSLNACAGVGILKQGKQIHALVLESEIPSDIAINNTLINMYAKCGSIEDACGVFNKMVERDVVSWTVMVDGYAQHGQGQRAFQLACDMQLKGLKLDLISSIGVLSACSHTGLADEGWTFFDCMSREHGIFPTLEHFACMVDLLGRAGQLEEAEEFIKQMPMNPSGMVWKALLGTCRIHGDLEVAKRASDCFFNLEPQDLSAVVMLSNIYAAADKWVTEQT